MPPVSPSRRRCFAPRVIRVDDALCGAARCRGIALCQRGIGAFKVIVGHAPLVDLQADRIGRVIRLARADGAAETLAIVKIAKARMRIRNLPCDYKRGPTAITPRRSCATAHECAVSKSETAAAPFPNVYHVARMGAATCGTDCLGWSNIDATYSGRDLFLHGYTS